MATIKEKYLAIKKAAQADVRAVRNRHTLSGGFWGAAADVNGSLLKQEVETAAILGYETHLRLVDDKLHIYYVAKMPVAPSDVLYG